MSSFKKFFSRKFARVLVYNTIIKTEENSNYDIKDMLIIHTANGLYQGKLKDSENYSDYEVIKGDDVLTIVRKLYLSSLDKRSEIEDDAEEFLENPLTIDLEDVTLITSGKNIKMPFVSIFVDQIIGISIGRRNEIEKISSLFHFFN